MRKWFVSARSIVVVIALVAAVACALEPATPTTPVSNSSPIQDSNQGPALPMSEVDEAKERLAARLIDMEGITGIGVGECNGADCIKVFVEEQTQELAEAIPTEFEGFPVEVEETGEVTAPPSDGQ